MATNSAITEEGTLGLRCWTGQSHGMNSAHRHLDLEINYVLAGTMTYLVGGRIVDLPQHRLCLLWGGVPHQMIHREELVEAIWVTIPITTILRWGLPDLLIRPLLATGFVADVNDQPTDLGLLKQWMEDIPARREYTNAATETGSWAANVVLLEIEARLRRLAHGLSVQIATNSDSARNTVRQSDQGLLATETMAHYITHSFREDIDIAQIANEAHLHPNYAMTLFRRHTGMTLSQYLTLQRVAHAQRLLATSNEAIQTIALESGFGSVSRFYEAFRQQTGSSPRVFRQQMRSASP